MTTATPPAPPKTKTKDQLRADLQAANEAAAKLRGKREKLLAELDREIRAADDAVTEAHRAYHATPAAKKPAGPSKPPKG